jgi:DNA-binding PadR family transcriptional regulator
MFVYNLISLRDQKVHISGVMLMCIISRLIKRTKSAYIAEIEAYYNEERNKRHTYKYKKSGIYAQLKRLRERGYVKVERHGNSLCYKLTRKGHVAVGLFVGKN